MSPNQPKTPISSFRLDDETKERLRRQASEVGSSMTEAIRRAAESMDRLNESVRRAFPEMAAHLDAVAEIEAQRERFAESSRRTVDELATYLALRDWPSASPRELSQHRSRTYSAMAAAILAGEAWAIMKAWPEVVSDIAGMRPA